MMDGRRAVSQLLKARTARDLKSDLDKFKKEGRQMSHLPWMWTGRKNGSFLYMD
jgi:hypothetical protein